MSAAGFFAPIAARVGRSVVRLVIDGGRNPAGAGAGIALGSDDLVVTNAHVAPGPRIAVVTPDGRTVAGRVVRRDPVRDLALVSAPGLGLPSVELADPRSVRAGALVIAIGHPLGVANAVSVGVLQTTGPAVGLAELLPGRARLDWVQAAVRLAPGNSGGPLADGEGRVLALATMIAGGLALGVPAPAVAAFVLSPPSARSSAA